jgi:hypothetical protein
MDVTEELDQDSAQTGEESGSERESKYETKDGKPYADDYLNLSEDRVAQLRSICNAMDGRDQWARMIELIRCTLRRYFLIGQQHPYWNADAGQFQVGPSGITLGDEDENQEEFFEEEFNLYAAYHDILSVFSQTAAPTRVEPSNLSGESVKASKEAEKYVATYEHFNPPEVRAARGGLADVDRRPHYLGHRLRAGRREVRHRRERRHARRRVHRYYGVLESKCPIVEPFKLWPYCRVDRDLDTLSAQDQNPKIASARSTQGGKGAIANNEIARMSGSRWPRASPRSRPTP